MVREIQRQPPVAVADRLEPAPDDFTRGGERIEVRRVVAVDPRGENLRLEDRGRERRTLDRLDRIEQRVEPHAGPDDALPSGQQPAEHRRIHGLYLLP